MNRNKTAMKAITSSRCITEFTLKARNPIAHITINVPATMYSESFISFLTRFSINESVSFNSQNELISHCKFEFIES